MHRPIVGITVDIAAANERLRAQCSLAYADAIAIAGGTPILLTPDPGLAEAQFRLCDAIVLTGGDDPRTEPFGAPTHPKATPVHPRRQAFETCLLGLLDGTPKPTLGVCLGMQMMALHAGGRLDQHMPDTRPDAARHWDAAHAVVPVGAAGRSLVRIPPGTVHSRHRQAVVDPGRLEVLGVSDDGVIEAIADTARAFHVGVQWHPERTTDAALGDDLFGALLAACGAERPRSAGPEASCRARCR